MNVLIANRRLDIQCPDFRYSEEYDAKFTNVVTVQLSEYMISF